MKHIFYVHSAITFFVAKQYIFERKISPKDCLFLLVRGYRLPKEYLEVFPNVISYPSGILNSGDTRIFQNNNPFKGISNIRVIEKKINQYFHTEAFTFYIPNTFALVTNIIATMKTCQAFYILEEGTASYIPFHLLPNHLVGIKRPIFLIVKTLFNRFYALRGNAFGTYHPKFKGNISISEKAFADNDGEKIIVSSPFRQITLEIVPNAIWSIDASLKTFFSIEDIENLFFYLRSIFKKKGYTKIAYKFHPDFYNSPDDLILFRTKIDEIFENLVYELPSSAVLEDILNSYEIDFYTDYSSVSIYAQKGTCYSYAQFLKPFNSTYAQSIMKFSIFDSFYKNIT